MTHEERVRHHMYETLEGIAEQSERIASLEELVADMWNGMCGYGHDCRSCEHYELYAEQRFAGECEYYRRMRELGVAE